MKQILLKNNQAILGYPVHLLVAITVAGIIIALITMGIYNLTMQSQTHQLKYEIEKIVSEAENMFEYADEGSLVTVSANFPSSTRFIIFGALPTNGSSEPETRTLDENTSNNYYFVMEDGTLETFHSNARFSAENTVEIALFRSGSYTLSLELVKTDGRTYVKIF